MELGRPTNAEVAAEMDRIDAEYAYHRALEECLRQIMRSAWSKGDLETATAAQFVLASKP